MKDFDLQEPQRRPGSGWSALDISDDAGFAAALALNREILHGEGDSYSLRHDLEWMAQNRDRATIHVYGRFGDPALKGFALLFRQGRPLPFRLGEMTILRIPLTRYELWSSPLLDGSKGCKDALVAATREFVHEMRNLAGPGDAISIEGLRTDSVLHALLNEDAELRDDFIVLPLDEAFEHQFISMPETFDAYLGQMSKRSRKSVQYSRRKLYRELDDDVKVVCYESVAAVDNFLDNAVEISRKTYQWRLLKLGLRDRLALVRNLTLAAERGWLRCYILYCRSAPVAFMIGYQCHGCYSYIDVGYDPDWASWSVGSVLQYEVLADLYRRPDTPRLFDFSTGYGDHKARFGNFSRKEVNVLLLPNTVRNRVIVGAYRFTMAVSKLMVTSLDRYGLKMPLKRFMRRIAG